MTGLSILFNLNTEEACYVYGHLESHRRANEQSIQQRYSSLLTPGRSRNLNDHRYTGSTDLTSYTPSYSDTSPRYRHGHHGFSEFQRESYISSPTLSSRGLYPDGDSMSRYNKNYDISNRNSSEFTTKSYDSQRFYDRGKLGLDRSGGDAVSPPFEFGVSYKTPKTIDTSTKNHDITTITSDRNSRIDDVSTRRSPARISSISDRDVVNRQSYVDAPIDRRRQRVGSTDSSSSHSSERSAGAEDKSVLSALKLRYQEAAEKQYDDPTSRAPFSTWRRSGNFEEVTSAIAPEAQKEKTKSLERKTYHREGDKGSTYDGSYHDDDRRSGVNRSRSDVKDSSATSGKQGEASADDLVFNFRQALRRHALSENEKAQELGKVEESSVPKIDIEDDVTAQRLERLRAARAKIHEKRQSEKVNSQSFATEFKIDKEKVEEEKRNKEKEKNRSKIDKDRQNKSRSESLSSVSSQHSDKDRVPKEEPVSKSEDQKSKQATKLARQKLVSDDLRAKYMIKRDDERESSPTKSDDNLSRKRSERKDRLKEHTQFWSKENEQAKDSSSVKSKESESVPSMEEMLLGSSRAVKLSSVSKKFQNVDHSSPFGSVYSKSPSVVTTTSSPASSSTSVTTVTSSHSAQPEKIEKVKNENLDNKTRSNQGTSDLQESKTETPSKKDKKYKKYAKAKSLELGALSKQEKTEPEAHVETQDDSNVDSDQLSQMGRIERIAKYKEERRKQLKSLQEKFGAGDGTELPSLFLSSKPASEDTAISRSKSLKVESDNKVEVSGSAMSRSKSLKQDKESDRPKSMKQENKSESYERANTGVGEPHKMPGLRLAEIGSQSKHESDRAKIVYDSADQKYDTESIIDKIHALRNLKSDQGKRGVDSSESSHDSHDVRYSKELKEDLNEVRPVSYASKVLLADRVMESPTHVPSGRERLPSSESDESRTERPVYGRPLGSGKDEDKKSYFEFGQVFTKKPVKSAIPEVKSEDDKDVDSGRDSVDSSARIRRKLPSVEDVLGTGEEDNIEKVDQHKQRKERESKLPVRKEPVKEEKSYSTVEEMNRKKVVENIEKAKLKFKSDEKEDDSFNPLRFELGTVYTGKKVEKASSDKTTKTETKYVDSSTNKQDFLENERRKMLGVNTTTEYTTDLQTKSPEIERQNISLKTETKSQKQVKEERKHKQQEDGSRKPPSSPRGERRKKAQERFGKGSGMAPAFEFGTSYNKKEPEATKPEIESEDDKASKLEKQQEMKLSVSRKEKERSPEQAPEVKRKERPKSTKEYATVKSYLPQPIQDDEVEWGYIPPEPEVEVIEEPKVSVVEKRTDTRQKFDVRAKTVSSANGQTVEMPSLSRGSSPVRAVGKSLERTPSKEASESAPETVLPSPEVKPVKFEIKSNKDTTKTSVAEPVKAKESSMQIKTLSSVDKAAPKQAEKQPERQTSITSLEVKQTSIKSTEPTVEKKVESLKMQPNIEKKIESPKVESAKHKERSEFTFESVSKAKVQSVEKVERKDEIKNPQQIIVPPREFMDKPASELIKPEDIKMDKDEKKAESLFEIHKKLVEEKLERKRESVNMEEKPVEKHETSEAFEYHKKQIAEFLDPRLVYHTEEKTSPKPEIDLIGKHEIDAQMVGLHRKEIEEKLEQKSEHPVHVKQFEKSEIEKIERAQILEKVKQKVEQPEMRKAIETVEQPVRPVEKASRSVMDTSLDDILNQNVEYLTEYERKGRSGGKKDRPQSIHEHQKGKRVLKKKTSSRRSKSEDRSRFKVTDSDDTEGHGSSRTADDSKRTAVSKKSSESKQLQEESTDGSSQKTSTEDEDRESHQTVLSNTSLGAKNTQRTEPVSKQEVAYSREHFASREGKNENQSNSTSGFQRQTASVSEVLYGSNLLQEAHDSLTEMSQSEFTSGMTSDTSDLSDRRRFISRDRESNRMGTDSDQSASSSALSEGSRKRRKDKSSMRKSKLNEASEDAVSSRRSVSSDDSSKTGRVGVRRVSSSRLARENREDKYKGDKQEVFEALKKHDLEITLTKPGTSHSSTSGTQSIDKHSINTDHKHVNNTESPRYMNKSVLDSHSVLPSRFALPSKVSAAISRLTESSEKATGKDGPMKTEDQSPKRIRRVNNFSQLLQKFSGSEASSSERSDSESPRRSKVFLKRQEACTVSSASSDDTRRTPERTQSLKLKNRDSPDMERETASSVQRSSSFKSDFMKRRSSPEPDTKRRLPNTPSEQSDKPSPELAKVLSKRNEIVAKQQEDGEVVERQRIHDGKVEKADKFSAAGEEEIIADNEVLQMLRSRRKETDSNIENSSVSESESIRQTDTNASKSDTKSKQLSQTSKSSVESDTGKGKVPSQSSVESTFSISLSNTEKEKVLPPDSHLDKQKSAKAKTEVPTLDLKSIDTSLDVLKTVTDDLTDTKHSHDKLTTDLSHVKVTSPTQVADFIHTVEKDNKQAAVTQIVTPAVEKEEQRLVVNKTVEAQVQSKSERVARPTSPTSPPHGSFNISSKSEIKRKISTKEGTPERQSPKRTGPMKVTTPSGSGLTRTESVGRSESERPKGILKRTPSLKQSGVIVDPELAEVLKSRRQRQDDVDEEEEDDKLTAEEEIRRAREEALSKEKDDSEEREVSVAERIFQMHTKIEEVKSCPITPKARSGFTTPKSSLQRSGNITPKAQLSFDEGGKQTSLSGSQLIERLASLEGRQLSITEKQQKFQKRRRDDARTRTQPVTLQEIQFADGLETVRKFRAEVIQKSSLNVFEALQKVDKQAPVGKTEFPQDLKPERRPRGQRHKTLPVTAAELSAIPEDKPSETMNSLKKKFESFGARDSKADSGILSGSDGDIITQEMESWRSLSVEENIGEDDPVKMSVSAKASMFHQIQESLKERKSASGAKRYIDRKKRERSRTLPITEDEVKLAAEIADKEEEEAKKAEKAEETPEQPAEEEVSDELSRQSLKDKVKLFTTIEEEKKAVAKKKGVPPPPKRRKGKLASRFATQPVTYEEVEKAAKISPLACSLVKPPDPEVLSGLSVKAQRELITQHAQQTLSQPNSRSGSRIPSRSTSIGDLSTEIINQDTLTVSNTDLNRNQSAADTSESVKPSDVRTKGFEVKRQEEYHHSSQTVEKVTSSKLDSQKKSILKSQLEEKLSLLHKGPLGVRPNTDAVPTISDINKALNKETSVETTVKTSEVVKTTEVKSILKKEGSFETRKMEVTTSAIRKSELTSDTLAEGDSEDNVIEGIDSSGDNLDSDEGILDDGKGEDGTKPMKKGSRSRRRFNRDRQLEQERYKTQPTEGSTETPESSRIKKKYEGRHFTQPVTPDEKMEAEIATEMPEITKTGSIQDRLSALKKSGDEDWRKRVSPIGSDLDRLSRRSASPDVTPPTAAVKLREKKDLNVPRPSSIADRLFALDTAQEGWRDRVGETDVKKFTIEHKISSSGQNIGESPLVARLRGKTPRKEPSRDSESSENSELISPTSPTKPLPMEIVCTDLPAEMLGEEMSPLATVTKVEEEEKATKVEVPSMDAGLDSFFQSRDDSVVVKSEELNVSVDDFNELFLVSNEMLETAKRAKPKRRFVSKSRNPLKTMSACLELKSEYTEVLHGVAERELKSVKVAALQQNSGFAVEALAGLASMENFSKIELRKTESNGSATPGSNTRLEPYLPLMLIHIKGRRKVQCRLVEPKADSINSGDCYVLVTPDKIIQWLGDYCNVIEKAKAADVCDFVKQKRDLGCKNAREVMTVEEKKGKLGNARHFWELLGGHKSYMASGPSEEDELYETHIVETNMIYKLENNKLVPIPEYWGNQPKYEMLQSSQVYVFDFGSELYMWQGKAVPANQRKVSLRLAQQLWNQGYDYSKCEINPICPLKLEDEGGLPNKSEKRPDWALFGKVNQNMETILFREKFADWPDTSRLIKVKSQEEITATKFDLADLKAFDAKLMVPEDMKPVTLVLEGSNVGRGTKWEQDMEGFIQVQDVLTLKVRVWHVLEYDHYEIEDHSYGQFHEGDTYVIRWQYMIVNAGTKSLKGQASRFSKMGRERCAYFFWQGKSSTINEKGASALMTVELDEERGPQVRVIEGKEPACFLNLFNGRMIIHIGKREEEETNTQGPWRFYCLRNEYDNEMCLIEVPKDICNLRSVSSSLLLNVVTGKLLVWHGCKSPEHTRKLAKKAADNLKERCPLEVGLHQGTSIEVTEVEEGCERTDFWRIVNVHIGDRSKYHCLIDNPESFSHTLRLFHMTSVSGIFEAHEILNPSRTKELATSFPVLQSDLYMVQQPALFLIDNGHEVYLWQGWWPEGDEDQENVLTGSAQTRFTADRRCAMETTIAYCKEINPEHPPPAYIVYAGLEPLSFTNLFPFWTVEDTAREINLRDGRTEGELISVHDLLKKLTKTRYTFAELLETPLPEGVDPLKLESYLSDEEFERYLEMTREQFYALPSWKQQKLKQQVELF